MCIREFANALRDHHQVIAIHRNDNVLITPMQMEIEVAFNIVTVRFHDATERLRELTLSGSWDRIINEVAKLHRHAYPLHSACAVC